MAETDTRPPARTRPNTGGTKLMGIPTWGWVAISTGVAVVGIVWWRNRKSNQAANSQQATTTPSNTDLTAGLATDQYETILSQIRDLQGQEAGEPAPQPGPPGPAGPPGTPGSPGAPGAPGPPPPPPHETIRYYKTVPGKNVTLNDLARWNSSSVAAIIAATKKIEPSDSSSPSSRWYQYLQRGNWNANLPTGYQFAIPVL